jgi:hypothetical protein
MGLIILLISLAIASFIAGLLVGKYVNPSIRKIDRWSIGIYTGKSPFALSENGAKNPVLTYRDVRDVPAKFVADPFMIQERNTWYMFFEVFNMSKNSGDIALATSNDGFRWTYKQVVVAENFHLSYPYVFKFEDEHYMVPESSITNSIRLYKAVEFPTKWEYINNLAEGRPFVDSSVVFFDSRWWMFTSSTECNVLYLYYAEELTGLWIEHPMSPIVQEDSRIARPGGRILSLGDKLFRYAQDDYETYGKQVHAFEIIKLTTENYMENAMSGNPILKASENARDWNGKAMHNVDPHKVDESKWIACVDGKRESHAVTIRNRYYHKKLLSSLLGRS